MQYKYVAVIGMDGMGNFNSKTCTPEFDRIFENGAVTFNALSMDPTISAENWGAMLLGADPLVHTLTNTKISSEEYTNKDLPSLFKRIRDVYPDEYLASCCNWDPINFGIVENGLDVDKKTASSDKALLPKIIETVKKKPKFLFVQFDDIDAAGHQFGYGTDKYLEAIRKNDVLLGKIYDAYEEAGILDDTLFITIADHGGYIKSHGGYTDGEALVFLGVTGKGVKKGQIKFAKTKDISAIVLYAFGLEIPKYNEKGFSSQIPEGIFEGTPAYFRKNSHPSVIKTKNTPGDLFAFFPKDDMKLSMHLDNSLIDSTGKTSFKENGTVKFYSNGVNSACGEFGKTGYADIEGISFEEENFTIALWLKIERSLTDAPAVISNKSWAVKHRDDIGFTLALRSNDIVFNLGSGDDCEEITIPFPEEISEGWVHCIVSFERGRRQIKFFMDFNHVFTLPLKESFSGNPDTGKLTIGNDTDGTYNKDMIFRADDIFIFNYAFCERDVQVLEDYYKR